MAELVFRPMTAPEIQHWYAQELTEAFAENERKPLPDILALAEAGRYRLLGLFDGPRMMGYATLWVRKGIPLVLLDYLGVSAALRSGGLGSLILARLREQHAPLVTESELPVAGDSQAANSLRLRRIAFYRRSGFVPVYEMATCGMRWQALAANADGCSTAEIAAWHRALYGPERTDVQIPLPPDQQPRPPYWMADR